MSSFMSNRFHLLLSISVPVFSLCFEKFCVFSFPSCVNTYFIILLSFINTFAFDKITEPFCISISVIYSVVIIIVSDVFVYFTLNTLSPIFFISHYSLRFRCSACWYLITSFRVSYLLYLLYTSALCYLFLPLLSSLCCLLYTSRCV